MLTTSASQHETRKRKMSDIELFDWLFLQGIRKESGCIEWTGGTTKSGYGRLRYGNKTIMVHRFVARMLGLLDTEALVCHKCDNTLCFEPSHLFTGTPQDNMTDKCNKNRQSKLKGSQQAGSKLTEKDVFEIKDLLSSGRFYQHEIGKFYGVWQTLISKIKHNKNWRHV